MTNGERRPSPGLFLRGEMQFSTAERALMRQRLDSKALQLILRLNDMYERFPDHMKEGHRTSMSVYVADTEMKQDLVESLELELQNPNLDDEERIAMEALLDIQLNGQRGLQD